MPQSTIGLRFNVDVGSAPTQVNNLTQTVAELNEELTRATEDRDWAAINQLSQAIDNATSARGRIMQQANQAQSQQARENMRNGGIFGSDSSDFGKYLLSQSLMELTKSVIASLEKGFAAAKQRAGGDYAGAAVTERRAEGELVSDVAGLVAGVAGFIGGGPWVAALASNLTKSIVGYFTGIEPHKMEEALAYSTQYKKIFPDIDTLNQAYGGDINKKTAEQNNTHGLEMYGRATDEAEGTGMTTQAFVEAMKQMGGYGIRSETQALNMAKTQALWSRFTGADLSTIQKYAGQSYRFGGDTGAVSTAYGGLMAQNMGKGQFSEFLNSMERILEEGIAKGFVRSSEEIAGNMQMLYNLSGGSTLWQGEQGAQRLSQMNMAISNSTNLQSVEDVINFGVAREVLANENKNDWKIGEKRKGITYTGTYADEMQLLERGVSAELLKGQFAAVSRLEGNNTAGIIERFKSMYGLNYRGATEVWGMYERGFDKETGKWKAGFSEEDFIKQIKDMTTKPGYASDSALLQDGLNKMANNLANIGKIHFDETEMNLLKTQADHVAAIRGAVTGERDRPDVSRREAAYLPETDAAGRAVRNTLPILVSNEYGIREGAVIDNLERLSSAAGQAGDYNNQRLGQKYNTDVFPLLEKLSVDNTSKDIIDLVYQLQRDHSNAVTGGEAGSKVGPNEFFELNGKLDALIEVLRENTRSTDENSKDRDIYVTVREF